MKKNVFTLLIFALVVSIIYCAAFTSESLAISNDGLMYYLSKVFFVDSIKDGEIPLWNPFVSIGTTFFGDVQNSVFCPFNLLYFIFDTTLAFNIQHVLALVIAGYFMYKLIDLFTNKYLVSLVFGFLFCFSTLLSGRRIEHTTIITTISLFPVIFYMLEKYNHTEENKWIIGCDIVMAIQFVSGFTQIVLYFDIVVFIYYLYICISKKRSIGETVLLGLRWVGIYVLLIGVQLVPMLVLTLASDRGNIQWESFSVLSYDLRILLMMVFPEIYMNQYAAFGDYNSSGLDIEIYVGIICLVYFIYELRYHEKKEKVLLGITLGTFIYGMIPHIPVLGKIVYHIPLLNSFRVCARSLPIAIFFTILLAGIGFASIYDNHENRIRLLKINCYLLVITCIVAVCVCCIFSQSEFDEISNYVNQIRKQFIIAQTLLLANLLCIAAMFKLKTSRAANCLAIIAGGGDGS